MSTPLTYDDLIRLIGENAVYIPNVERSKAPAVKGWPKLTLTDTRTPQYQAQLRGASGHSVLLGKPSGGIVTIDADSDEGLGEMLALNPIFGTTLVTRGERGGNIWLRMTGEYPAYQPLETKDGVQWGEFRS